MCSLSVCLCEEIKMSHDFITSGCGAGWKSGLGMEDPVPGASSSDTNNPSRPQGWV